MKRKMVFGIGIFLTLLVAQVFAVPIDHVYVSSTRVDKLNLDGSLDMNFLPTPSYGGCGDIAVNGNTGDVWLGCDLAYEFEGSVFRFDSVGNMLNYCQVTYHPPSPVPFYNVFCLSNGGLDPDGESCIDPYGNAWFTDRVNDWVWKFQPDGTRSGPFSVGASGPWAITCDRFGNVWTTNMSPGNVSKLANNGTLISTFPYGANRAIVTDQDSNIYVTEGSGVRKLGNDGSNLGYFPINLPTGLAIDNAGNIWVSRTVDNTVSKLSSTGTNLGNFPVTNPYKMAIDASGNVWVVSGIGLTITKLSNDGANLGTFSLTGTNGQVDTGFLHQRFVLGYDSVEGPNVWAPINGGAPARAVTLTFANITTKGNSAYTESSTGNLPPVSWKLGSPPRYYNISTTATYTGNVEVCIGYNETEFTNELSIKLYHFGTDWQNITTSIDTAKNIVCGNTTSFSEFALMEPMGGGPAMIPTLSEWGMIILAVMLMIALVWRLKKESSGCTIE